MAKKIRIYDLSTTIENCSAEPWPPEVVYFNHREGAKSLGNSLGLEPSDFPGGMALAWERLTLITHGGTHLDAPWHFGPTSEGKPSKTIDQIPLEWCYSDGVLLDLHHKKANESITIDDIKAALAKVGYKLKPFDIVLLMTGADKYIDNPQYSAMNPGMSPEATLWLIEQGVKVIGTDGYGYDKAFAKMGEEYKAGDKKALWPGHFAGREREYCHIEKLANLDKLPRPYGFKVAVFPVKIARASAGWTRPVAIFEED